MTMTAAATYPLVLLRRIFVVLLAVLKINSNVFAWQANRVTTTTTTTNVVDISRRNAISIGSFALLPFLAPIHAIAAEEDTQQPTTIQFENRKRNGNKDAIIREDYWFMMGKTPPRKLPSGALEQADDPQWNAFGSCQTQKNGDGAPSNSCTYVSLKQRIPTYSKYGFSISLGAKEYGQLGKVLKEAAASSSSSSQSSSKIWNTAASYVIALPQEVPPPTVDALVKMVLFASGMLTSPNYSGPSKRLLVARYYANETSFATKEIRDAIEAQDVSRALAAWEYGKDSFNSWIECVNDSISSKVGDKFELIS